MPRTAHPSARAKKRGRERKKTGIEEHKYVSTRQSVKYPDIEVPRSCYFSVKHYQWFCGILYPYRVLYGLTSKPPV